MKTIYLVRHGESVINVSDKYEQNSDSPLTENGEKQAARIADRATRLKFDALIASPFLRTKQTAELIAKATGKTIEFHSEFQEREMPHSIVGKAKLDEVAKATVEAAFLSSVTRNPKIGEAETFDELVARADKALEILKSHSSDSILVVGHGFFTRILIARMLYGDAFSPEIFEPFSWGLRTRNTGLSVIHFNPEDTHRTWWLSVWNDHAHLA